MKTIAQKHFERKAQMGDLNKRLSGIMASALGEERSVADILSFLDDGEIEALFSMALTDLIEAERAGER